MTPKYQMLIITIHYFDSSLRLGLQETRHYFTFVFFKILNRVAEGKAQTASNSFWGSKGQLVIKAAKLAFRYPYGRDFLFSEAS